MGAGALPKAKSQKILMKKSYVSKCVCSNTFELLYTIFLEKILSGIFSPVLT
jgi:hypothetical protein